MDVMELPKRRRSECAFCYEKAVSCCMKCDRGYCGAHKWGKCKNCWVILCTSCGGSHSCEPLDSEAPCQSSRPCVEESRHFAAPDPDDMPFNDPKSDKVFGVHMLLTRLWRRRL